jgi:hypothetical protein
VIAAITSEPGQIGASILTFSVMGLIFVARHWPPRTVPGRTGLSLLLDGLPAITGEGLGWCGECTGQRWGDQHADGSHTCATCRAHTPSQEANA